MPAARAGETFQRRRSTPRTTDRENATILSVSWTRTCSESAVIYSSRPVHSRLPVESTVVNRTSGPAWAMVLRASPADRQRNPMIRAECFMHCLICELCCEKYTPDCRRLRR